MLIAPMLRSDATKTLVSLLHSVELTLARGFGVAPAFVLAQQLDQRAWVAGAR